MIKLSRPTIQRIYTGLGLAGAVVSIYWFLPPIFFSAGIILVLSLILIHELPTLTHRASVFRRLFLIIYLIVPGASAILLNQSMFRPLLLWAIVIVALFDSVSFAIGKPYGKHAIAPAISPGKSWEGFLAGLLAVVIVCSLAGLGSNQPLYGALTGVGIAVLSFSGDLFESWLKRQAGVKDSGSLLPGHGGLLDRCDGLLPVIVLVYVCKQFLYGLFFS